MSSLPTVITNSFKIPVVQKFENIFTHIFLSFPFALGFILFLEVSAKFMMTKISETQVHSFHAHVDIKHCLHISKVHLEMKELMNKSKKTAPSWSYILTPLVPIDKFFEIWSNLRRSEFELHL